MYRISLPYRQYSKSSKGNKIIFDWNRFCNRLIPIVKHLEVQKTDIFKNRVPVWRSPYLKKKKILFVYILPSLRLQQIYSFRLWIHTNFISVCVNLENYAEVQ